MDPTVGADTIVEEGPRRPAKWVRSCQECLKSLDLDEEKYSEFTKTYEKNLTALLKSLGWSTEENIFNLGIDEYFLELSRLTGIDFPLCTECLSKKKHSLLSGSSKEKNVGYVLEHLIGAMTVQKMIDAKKEECTPLSQDESEVTEVAELSTEELEAKQVELSKRIHDLRSKLAVIERQKLSLEKGKKKLDDYRDGMNTVSAEISLRLGEEQSKRNYVFEAVCDHERQLDLLLRCNAVNDAINVWIKDGTITVNGIKPTGLSYPDQWMLVSAVLGELALLTHNLHLLIRKPYSEGEAILTRGAYTQVVNRVEKKCYPLYFNPRTDNRKLYTTALMMFFKIVYELVDHCKTKLNVEVKYQMDKNYSVGGYDFLSFDYNIWKNSLRCLAVNIKQLVVYTHASTILLTQPKI